MIAAGTGGAILVVAIGAFFVFGHGKSAASGSDAAATVQAAVSAAPSFTSEPITANGKPDKPATGAKPSSSASPAAAPTATPNATPTPLQTQPPTAATAAETAKAKRQAAHLTALRRQQAAALAGTSGAPSLSLGRDFKPSSSVTNTSSVPVPTQAPTEAAAVATPDAGPTPVYAPRVIVDARFVDRVAPVYPDIAREQGVQGTAIVLATVGPKGNVISVQIDQSAGNKLLDQAALFAARSSRFVPPEIDGKPATETYRIVYSFDPNA
jgi:protein TonB